MTRSPDHGDVRGAANVVVMKFGGTSVSAASHWTTIAALVEQRKQQGLFSVVVCSALDGVSNELARLIELFQRSSERGETDLAALKTRHQDFLCQLGLDRSLLDDNFVELQQLLYGMALLKEDFPSLRARIMCQGEFLLTRMGVAYLERRGLSVGWQDVRQWLQATGRSYTETYQQEQHHFLTATCDYSYDPEPLQQHLSLDGVITQGFVARDAEGKTVLLGRGGSDTSASYLAAKFGAQRLEIWTDVPGIFTAHPKMIASSKLLLQLGYDEAQELASSGAKVLHPRCVEPVRKAKIPLHIRWTLHPEDEAHSTCISSRQKSYPYVKGICIKENVYVLSMDSMGMWNEKGFLAELFAVFKRHHISIDTVSTSESNVTVTLDSRNSHGGKEQLEVLTQEIAQFCRLKVYADCVSVALVGRNIRSILHRIAPVFMAFENIKVYAVSQAANNLNFSFTVEKHAAEKVLTQLHDLLFSSIPQNEVFGPHWHDLVAEDGTNADRVAGPQYTSPWWCHHVQELVSLYEQENHGRGPSRHHPLYVYDLHTIDRQIQELQSASEIDRVFYALKANHYPEILQLICERGLGFDCVSLGEIEHLKKHLDRWRPEQIAFTPNFSAVEEYERALEYGVVVTLDNVMPLITHPQVFAGRSLMLRLDPGMGRGHHEHVRTAGNQSKFGISAHHWEECLRLVRRHKIEVMGLHAHLGSGISSHESWLQSAVYLARLAQDLGGVRVLNLGGGFPAPEKPSDPRFHIQALNEALKTFKKSHPQFEIWVEPGRFLVAEAGVLLSAVQQIKHKGHKTFIGVNAGMHCMIRPALYGAYHHVVNLSQYDQKAVLTADVVGPICESGDTLARARKLPPTELGDVLLLAGAGAYGEVMSMSYNLRPAAREVVFPHKKKESV